ncbi:AAA family ATPase [Actinomadura harenae]|uniref:Helix-turn-helix transcriptional regulator n=1 Tax=Actinomadura harenae TaxID=2483351 RepID=A0A3M2M3B5_9ACTN|nr:LuxR family transcriptional regulator [Actinomadura harenae]RMI44107.1 helix-turn-helix transcriptional regulator [Actinomadura harenae]
MGVFISRRPERQRLEGLLHAARDGRGGSVVVHGEPGIGKTALLEHVSAAVPGFGHLRTVGREFAGEVPYSALEELCGPVLDERRALPGPQRVALEVALGLRDGDPPDRFRVGLAVLGLLSEAAGDRPIACLVDDAQWIDHASLQALAFAARRLAREPVAFLFALRDPRDAPPLDGLPRMPLTGLGPDAARNLLDSRLHTSLDERVRERIITETKGNPLALLSLHHGVDRAGLAGGFALPEVQPLQERIAASYRTRLAALPEETRRLLLVAAAEPLGDPLLLWKAAGHLGLGEGAMAPAEADGLLEIGVRVRFAHPLVRSAVYCSAAPGDRRAAHRALADATESATDRDRRAWHGAQAAEKPDEDIATELERCADRARGRGGVAAAAAFLARAGELSPDPARRAPRALAAAELKFRAGAAPDALRLLEVARAGPLGRAGLATAELLAAQLAAHAGQGRQAPLLLRTAAVRLAAHDRPLARETCLDAVAAAMWAGRIAGPGALTAAVRAVASAVPDAAETRPLDLLLDGLILQLTRGHRAAVPLMRRAVDAFLGQAGESRWLWLACSVATDLWDEAAWRVLSERQATLARESGALTSLPTALHYRALAHIHAGEFAGAADLVDEAYAVEEAGGTAGVSCADLALRAWRGDQGGTSEAIATSARVAHERGEGRTLSAIDYAAAVLHNGSGDHASALKIALSACEDDEPGFHTFLPPELVEAAALAGRPSLAVPVVERLAERAEASGTAWATGIALRSRALLSTGPETGELYAAAIEHLSRSEAVLHLARTHLLYGEWLRREGRRRDAITHLRTAHQRLTSAGAAGFARRAARELAAVGERPPKAAASPWGGLTAQEARVAALVAAGATNREAAERLFLSPRTVDAHMRNILRKLGLASRKALRDLR